jgi:hypothetical protein
MAVSFITFLHICLALFCVIVYMVVCSVSFCLKITYSYCNVFLLLCIFRCGYSVLRCSECCLCVNVFCTTATGINLIAINKHIVSS